MVHAEVGPDLAYPDARGLYADGAVHGRSIEPPAAGDPVELSNLIQVASEALDRVASDSSNRGVPPPDPALVRAKAALERAALLLEDAVDRVQLTDKELGQTDVSVCLAAIELLVRSTWEPSISVEVRLPADLPVVQCDCLNLQNAVLNLVFNARDAMPDGGLISIEVATLLDSNAATLIELRVADHGIGMTPSTMARAFEPFFTTKGKGLGGVGLPMARHFAMQLGGDVDIESTPGSGTTAILRIPVVRSESDGR